MGQNGSTAADQAEPMKNNFSKRFDNWFFQE